MTIVALAIGCGEAKPSGDGDTRSDGSTTGTSTSGDASTMSASMTGSTTEPNVTTDGGDDLVDTSDGGTYPAESGTTGQTCPEDACGKGQVCDEDGMCRWPCAEYDACGHDELCDDDGLCREVFVPEPCGEHDYASEPILYQSTTALDFVDADGDAAHELLLGTWDDGLMLVPGANAGPAGVIWSGTSINGLATGDLEGDGDEDIVVATLAGVVVLLNDGAGGFSEDATVAIPQGRLALADFDGADPLDVLSWNDDTPPQILIGQPGLTYVPSDAFVLDSPAWFRVAVGRYDARGAMDVAVLDGSHVDWWLSDASVGGQPDVTTLETPEVSTEYFATGDFDGDGLDDVARVVNIWNGNWELVDSWRGGTFESMLEWQSEPPNQDPTEQWIGGVGVGDFDGDGHDDLALTYDGWMRVRYGEAFDGEDAFGCLQTYDLDSGYLGNPLSGDFDGNGADDLVWESGTAITWFHRL